MGPINRNNPDAARLAEIANGAGAGALSGSSFGPIAALAGGVIGGASSAYGSYLQSQQADQQYQLALDAWQQEQERQKRMDAQNQQQQAFQNSVTTGQYATAQAKDIQDPYIQYARALGR